jgi:hypothetical protein
VPALEHPDLSLLPTEAELGPVMQRSLTALLDRVPGARDVLPTLAALENGLSRHGSAAVQMIPPKALPRLHSQLVSLPLDASDAALKILRARVAAALEAQRAAEAPPPPASRHDGPQFLSTFTGDDRLQVSEISHSSFLAEVEAQRTRPGAGDTVPAQLFR